MKRLIQLSYGLAAGALLAVPSGVAAQFVAATNYPQAYQQTAPSYPSAAPQGYAAVPGQRAIAPPSYGAAQPVANQPSPAGYATQPAPAYTTQPAPAYASPAAPAYIAQSANAQRFAAPGYGAPAYAAPRMAQASELPAPAEAVGSMAPEITPAQRAPATSVAPSAMSYGGSYTQHTNHVQPSYAAPMGVPASAGCATGNCGGGYTAAPAPATSYGYGGCDTGSCATGNCGAASYGNVGYESCYGAPAPACDVGCAPVRKRQWFAGVYGLYLNRVGDQGKAAVAYLTDTATFTGNYYPNASDPTLFTVAADNDGQFGAEIRFGSTFGNDPCNCNQPFAWEVGYWGLDDDSSSSVLALPGSLSAANTMRLYSQYNYRGLNADLDGAGTDWADRPMYLDDGEPADADLYATDVRLLAVRVRQRFTMQNLELNFWRFGTPTTAAGCGVGLGGGAGACGGGSCGVDACGGCAPVACAPARPPRRFFINGLAGVRYLRVDDDFGLDQRFAIVNTTAPNQGEVPTGTPTGGWVDTYDSFPNDNQTIYSDFEADNELVGFQLGCSMNWLVGCRWNVFADSNFGIYGNNASVYKRVYGGGASQITYANGGGEASVRGSETNVAFLGELRAGVGYQVSCNCRLTAAYRFIGVGGVALGVEEFQNTDWTNASTAAHIDTNNSIVMHGLQTGVEYKY